MKVELDEREISLISMALQSSATEAEQMASAMADMGDADEAESWREVARVHHALDARLCAAVDE